MISLDSLGHFRHEAGSQRALSNLDVPLPSVGDFLLVLGTESAEPISRQLLESCPAGGGVQLIARTERADAEPPLASDAWPYQKAGMPALLVSDTKSLRTEVDASPLQHLDFDRLTRFVTCFSRGIRQLADAPALAASGSGAAG